TDRRFANRRSRRARNARLLVNQVLELHVALLEAGGVHVREIVRDGVDVGLLGIHAAGSGVERADHRSLPSCSMARPSTSFIISDMAFCKASKLRVTPVSSATRSTSETFDCSREPVV